jgi:hypothetical protein
VFGIKVPFAIMGGGVEKRGVVNSDWYSEPKSSRGEARCKTKTSRLRTALRFPRTVADNTGEDDILVCLDLWNLLFNPQTKQRQTLNHITLSNR